MKHVIYPHGAGDEIYVPLSRQPAGEPISLICEQTHQKSISPVDSSVGKFQLGMRGSLLLLAACLLHADSTPEDLVEVQARIISEISERHSSGCIVNLHLADQGKLTCMAFYNSQTASNIQSPFCRSG